MPISTDVGWTLNNSWVHSEPRMDGKKSAVNCGNYSKDWSVRWRLLTSLFYLFLQNHVKIHNNIMVLTKGDAQQRREAPSMKKRKVVLASTEQKWTSSSIIPRSQWQHNLSSSSVRGLPDTSVKCSPTATWRIQIPMRSEAIAILLWKAREA